MFELHYQLNGLRRQTYRCMGSQCVLGRGRDTDLVLASRTLASRHARFELQADGLYVIGLDQRRGCWVNGERIGEQRSVSQLDEVSLGDVQIQIGRVGRAGGADDDRIPTLSQADSATSATSLLPLAVPDVTVEMAGHVDAAMRGSRCVTQVDHDLAQPDVDLPEPRTGDADGTLTNWCRIVHERLLQQMDLRRKDVNRMSDAQLREESTVLITGIVEQMVDELPATLNVAQLIACVLDEAIGLGPLEQFLNDDSVTEIMVNNHREIFVERAGRLERSAQQFSSDRTIYAVIERIITPLGRRIDESSPIVDARLKDGSRVNAVIPPLALKGPCLTIRKFPEATGWTFDDLLAAGSIDPAHGRIPAHLRAATPEHRGVGRYRLGQDHAAERAVELHTRWRTHRDDRGCCRAQAGSAQPGGARVAPCRTWRGAVRYPCAIWCGTRCACAPTASWSVSVVAVKPSTCCRP